MEALSRIVIFGNSGSGKSTLARNLAALADAPIVDLDIFHWECDGFGAKRDEREAQQMVVTATAGPRWIVEGVYGWLVEVAVPRAMTLICWICPGLPVAPECLLVGHDTAVRILTAKRFSLGRRLTRSARRPARSQVITRSSRASRAPNSVCVVERK
jgi:adenylate kinase family enzyme